MPEGGVHEASCVFDSAQDHIEGHRNRHWKFGFGKGTVCNSFVTLWLRFTLKHSMSLNVLPSKWGKIKFPKKDSKSSYFLRGGIRGGVSWWPLNHHEALESLLPNQDVRRKRFWVALVDRLISTLCPSNNSKRSLISLSFFFKWGGGRESLEALNSIFESVLKLGEGKCYLGACLQPEHRHGFQSRVPGRVSCFVKGYHESQTNERLPIEI
jgi:hypothetical protein